MAVEQKVKQIIVEQLGVDETQVDLQLRHHPLLRRLPPHDERRCGARIGPEVLAVKGSDAGYNRRHVHSAFREN